MELTEEQTMIRDMAREFARERLVPYAAEWDRNGTFPAEALQEMAQLGLYGMMVPEEWGRCRGRPCLLRTGDRGDRGR